MKAFSPLKLLTLTALMVVDAGCQPASYEVLKPAKSEAVTPPDVKVVPPDENAMPTARVEVMWNNESVVKIRVNEPTLIRPTTDTVDPDDIGKSSCVNPGIIRAAYTVGQESSPSAARTNCEPLSVPYTFTRTGTYEITMTVTSNENETSTAKMTLVVVDATTPINQGDGGFTIAADPMIGSKDQNFTFSSFCALKNTPTVSWEFGDGQVAQGPSATHIYGTIGAHTVTATCTDSTGKRLTAQIVVVTMNKPVIIPVYPPKPVLPPVTPPPVQPLSYDPGTGTYYDPSMTGIYQPSACPCTDPYTGTWYDTDGQYYMPY